MKNLSRLFFAMTLLLAVSISYGQDKNNPWAFGLGVNAVDLYPVGEDSPRGAYFDEYFNANDHWNILPAPSVVSVSRYISDGFTFTAQGSLNRINKIGTNDFMGVTSPATAPNLTYFAVDGLVSYSFMNIINSQKLDPFIGIGGGYTWVDDIGFGTLNGSLGLKYWLNDNFGLTAQSTYKHAFDDFADGGDGAKHFQHSVGFAVRFGGTDTDGDGIYDQDDACPDVAGLEAFNGCPDSDNDGIEDSKDDCPNEAGLAEFNGCPDADGDGIKDGDDKCPTTPGLASLAGCPDADGDGVADGDDNCPNEAGPSANNGCPWPDTDGDGVLDKDDQCPNEAGEVANNGCPKVEPTPEVMKQLNDYARTILFNTGKSSLKKASDVTLNAMVAILKEYPKAKFELDGYTDSVGSAKSNQLLSERRANAVRDYLIANGIGEDRLVAKGFGEENPIDTNKTRAGRANNRRVEVKVIK
ncbi:OmpA family protein [Ichthyenterobacterium sp. W332]|uniref:OmpA family protein n=1 Tax=Microcosmobacter mediterraneus TaxID=3075607 RepID=A0ABU2YIE4_9FLAO|nr:OmpA family protein [Ichthyenterobacterium sp. W332]MDT0557945.1 OmpA family protein [Ichthyenterobacterium sp. W332]